jgi:PAS domain S-box-containing protein
VYITLVLAFILTVFSGCRQSSKEQAETAVQAISFRDIPGITQSEIMAIEALQGKYSSFVYGINPTTEAFTWKDGELDGYAVMLCKWLSNMFGIEFKPKYYQWNELFTGLDSGEIDFTGEFMAISEIREEYFQSNPTINRTIKGYRIVGSTPIDIILQSRMPRYAFLRGAVVADDVDRNTPWYSFERVIIDNHMEAYELLKSGEIDSFFGLDTAHGFFDAYEDVVGEDFYPLIFRSSCLSAHKEELRPIITALDKVMSTRVLEYLTSLQKSGYERYLRNRMDTLLTEEERLYIVKHPVIPIAADFSNYPISFFDRRTGNWEGIYFEALGEISKFTGLTFEIGNDQSTLQPILLDRLEKGELLIIPELFQIKEYAGRFLWSEVPVLTDNYVFISKADFRNIDVNDVFHLRVGMRKDSLYSEIFKTVFPAHTNYIEYDTQEDAWAGLEHDEFDVLFSSRRRLLIYTNYYEESGYKLNLVFSHWFSTYFGYNKDAALLKSIVDKALRIINIDNISSQWIYKTYDYRSKVAAAQRPWLIGAGVLFFMVLALITVLFIRSRRAGKELEDMVKHRTNDLAFQTSKLQAVFDSIPDLLFCKDLEYKYTQCNLAFEKFMGLKEDEFLGKTNQQSTWLTPEQMERLDNIEHAVISDNRAITFEEVMISPVTGEECDFETVKSPIRQNGVVIGTIAIRRNITQRKEMERELAFETSKLQAMFDSVPDIMFCKDTKFQYTQCNNSFEQYMGVNEADLLGLTNRDGPWFTPEQVERIQGEEQAVIAEDRSITLEERVFSPVFKKECYFETVKAPIRQNGIVVGIIAIVRDITRRKEMEEEVQAASRAKSSFLANMSHELRTPLNVVIGLTELVLEDDNMEKHVTDNLIKINSAGTTLLSIVNDILDFSKIESGKLEISPVDYYVTSLLNDIITLVITRLGEKPIKFSLDIEDDLPGNLLGDDLRVKQVFTNLLTNAIKYTRQGSITLKVRHTCEGDDTVWMDISVSDTGQGIHKEDIEHLFTDYYQTNASANRNIEGTGLGLPITKRLVELMGGKIHAESEFGKGSTFFARMRQGVIKNAPPLGAAVADELRNFCYADDKRVATKKLIRLNLSYAKVLVVDDMQTNLDVASGLFGKYKMQVDCASSGQEAIDRIRGGVPVYNAIFMDHMMPGMDGIEAADRIRALGTDYAKNIPIIALTANAIQGTDKMFYEHGFQAFTTKPINVIELDSVIRKWVRDEKREEVTVLDDIAAAEDVVIKIPGVDTEKGLSLYAGDTKVYLPMLRSYITNTPVVLEKLRNVTAETLPAYVISVHGLKGTSAGIGAEAIRQAALELEGISRAGDLQGVLKLNKTLITDTEIVVANVKEWLAQHDIQKAKPRQKAPDVALLEQLKQCFDSYDMAGIDTAMLELERFDYDEGADLMVLLREKIETAEFDAAVERITQYEGELVK